MTTDVAMCLDRLRLATSPYHSEPERVDAACEAYLAARAQEKSRAPTLDSLLPISVTHDLSDDACGATNVDATGRECAP